VIQARAVDFSVDAVEFSLGAYLKTDVPIVTIGVHALDWSAGGVHLIAPTPRSPQCLISGGRRAIGQ